MEGVMEDHHSNLFAVCVYLSVHCISEQSLCSCRLLIFSYIVQNAESSTVPSRSLRYFVGCERYRAGEKNHRFDVIPSEVSIELLQRLFRGERLDVASTGPTAESSPIVRGSKACAFIESGHIGDKVKVCSTLGLPFVPSN